MPPEFPKKQTPMQRPIQPAMQSRQPAMQSGQPAMETGPADLERLDVQKSLRVAK
jgi:hypothetical protein